LHRKVAAALAAERSTHNGLRLLLHRSALQGGQQNGQRALRHTSLRFVAAELSGKRR